MILKKFDFFWNWLIWISCDIIITKENFVKNMKYNKTRLNILNIYKKILINNFKCVILI